MEPTLLHRKESILLTTVEVIDELGIQGFTTREIARRQGMSEGALFRHFKTKNDLMMAVLDHYSQYDQDIIASIEMRKMKPREGIVYFVNAYAEYYGNYPAITAITQLYDSLSYDEKLDNKIKEILASRVQYIEKMIKDAQDHGELSKNIDSEKLAYIINGFRREICLRWRFSKYSFDLKETTLSTLNMILDAFHS